MKFCIGIRKTQFATDLLEWHIFRDQMTLWPHAFAFSESLFLKILHNYLN